MKLPRKIKKKIPRGMYCYAIKGKMSREITPIKPCPFYQYIKVKDKKEQDDIDKNYPEEIVSRCKLTGIEDDIALNDSCKCCHVNLYNVKLPMKYRFRPKM